MSVPCQLCAPMLMAAALLSIPAGAGAAPFQIKIFDHDVEVRGGDPGEEKLILDGRDLTSNGVISLDQIATMGAVGYAIGSSGTGGNACDPAPFVIAFPPGQAPRFDGPIDTCAPPSIKVGSSEIMFETSASPTQDGERWRWSLQDGIQPAGKVGWVVDPSKGWPELRQRAVTHPAELYHYGPIVRELEQMLGSDASVFREIVSGVGSASFEGDKFVGTGCVPHDCGDTGALLIADIPTHRMFAAWKPNGKPIAVMPKVGEWPKELRYKLKTWAADYK